MHLQLLDWLVVLVPLAAVLTVALKTRRHVHGVADFMAAGRVARRYLLCTAQGEASYGLISAVAAFEMLYIAGFTIAWWQKLSFIATLLLALSGYVTYRYRQTRVLTLAQFFEIRYSKRFRIFAGGLAFFSGVINYGIFPAVGARFFVYFCGLPPTLTVAGVSLPTFAPLMAVFLGAALLLTLAGGQVTIMITDCVEGLISGLLYLVVIAALLTLFRWDQIAGALAAQPPGHSLLNPFDSLQLKDFNISYILLGLFTTCYAYQSWQGGHAFRSSAANPHEAKMANILGNWRSYARGLMFVLLAVCAYTYLHHADFAAGAQAVAGRLRGIENPQIQQQMRVPLALAYLLPTGIKGVLAAILLFAMLACDGSYLHSWGSIFIQDVVLPLRRLPLETQRHLRLLRGAIVGVAIFAFGFSLLFRQTDHILMFFAITGAIFSGAGAAIIGGLYWKKGTAAAAWASLLTGSALAVAGLVIRRLHPDFPVNGVWMQFIAQVSSVAVYVTVSLLTCRVDFDMDRMLHRGAYALPGDAPAAARPRITWGRLAGFDREFTRGDRWISGGLLAWSMFWFGVFLVACGWNLVRPWPVRWWSAYWRVVGILVPLVVGSLTTIWFTWGGVRDLRHIFAALKALRRDARDDGRVPPTAEDKSPPAA